MLVRFGHDLGGRAISISGKKGYEETARTAPREATFNMDYRDLTVTNPA